MFALGICICHHLRGSLLSLFFNVLNPAYISSSWMSKYLRCEIVNVLISDVDVESSRTESIFCKLYKTNWNSFYSNMLLMIRTMKKNVLKCHYHWTELIGTWRSYMKLSIQAGFSIQLETSSKMAILMLPVYKARYAWAFIALSLLLARESYLVLSF